jgi:hypothetical protein
MTVALRSAKFSASKGVLQDALNTQPDRVEFHDPSLFNERWFTGHDIKVGERFPVVMDPATRRRFSTVVRKSDGTFKVT